MLWRDESKINRLGLGGQRFVRIPINQEFNLHYVSPAVKHGGGSSMVWVCICWNGKEKYVEVTVV